SRLSTLDSVASLTDKSLLQAVGGDDRPRFRMLETVREYGRERLAAAGEESATRDAHAEVFLALAKEAEPHLKRREQLEWFARLEAEHDNLRAALAWLRERGDAVPALRMGGALWFFWWMRGYYAEGKSQFDALLAMPGADAPTAGRPKAFNGAGVIALWLGDADRSEALHGEALALAREHGDRAEAAFALLALSATIMVGQADYVRGESAAAESLALYREIGDPGGIAGALVNRAVALDTQGKLGEADPLLQEAVAIERELGNRWNLNILLGNLGKRAVNRGERAHAKALFAESLALARDVGDKRGIGTALCNLVVSELDFGDRTLARALADEALAIGQEIGDKPTQAAAMECLGRVHQEQGESSEAITALQRAVVLNLEIGNRVAVACGLPILASLVADPVQAARLIGASMALREAGGAPPSPAELEEIERFAGAALAALGPAAFASAMDAGRELSFDDAVSEALALAAASPTSSVTAKPGGQAGAAHNRSLTSRELDVLRRIAAGSPDRQIAEVLFVSRRTVNTHVASILRKLDASSRAAAVGLAVRDGLV
ncbi:MAG TPA: LuxR C-terminal-related transcriptional regulator, partial [Methylomirabilota bacterium]|nr:LuxR C-terminal-related transcriptional regulator [Methylomirabilota bacterium]